jgi:hypothetical protein
MIARMSSEPIFFTLIFLALLFGGLAVSLRKKGFQSPAEFFLASQSLRPSLITSLLISGSFSLNGMLYQIYLGYKIGAWALLTQLAWATSFFLLAKFAPQITNSKGLHNFLGSVFSPATRRVAALCSIIGLGLQIGWEFGVAKTAFAGLASPPLPSITIELIVFTILAITTFYTLIGGLRSNSWSDLIQNLTKGACFALLGILLFNAGGMLYNFSWVAVAVVPPFSKAVAELMLTGLIANICFSVVWQFVDMSTWQTAIATEHDDGSERSLKAAGVWVFIAPGVLGTVIGLGLTGQAGLDSNSVLPALIQSISPGPVLISLLTLAIATTVMSFVDGIMLAIGFTLISDLLFIKSVDRHDLLTVPSAEVANDPTYQRAASSVLGWTRVCLIIVTASATYGLALVASVFKISPFDLVYIVIISQLALFGPVLCGLLKRRPRTGAGPSAILVSLVSGYALAIYGAANAIPDLVNGASLVTLGTSIVIAFFGSAKTTNIDTPIERLAGAGSESTKVRSSV